MAKRKSAGKRSGRRKKTQDVLPEGYEALSAEEEEIIYAHRASQRRKRPAKSSSASKPSMPHTKDYTPEQRSQQDLDRLQEFRKRVEQAYRDNDMPEADIQKKLRAFDVEKGLVKPTKKEERLQLQQQNKIKFLKGLTDIQAKAKMLIDANFDPDKVSKMSSNAPSSVRDADPSQAEIQEVYNTMKSLGMVSASQTPPPGPAGTKAKMTPSSPHTPRASSQPSPRTPTVSERMQRRDFKGSGPLLAPIPSELTEEVNPAAAESSRSARGGSSPSRTSGEQFAPVHALSKEAAEFLGAQPGEGPTDPGVLARVHAELGIEPPEEKKSKKMSKAEQRKQQEMAIERAERRAFSQAQRDFALSGLTEGYQLARPPREVETRYMDDQGKVHDMMRGPALFHAVRIFAQDLRAARQNAPESLVKQARTQGKRVTTDLIVEDINRKASYRRGLSSVTSGVIGQMLANGMQRQSKLTYPSSQKTAVGGWQRGPKGGMRRKTTSGKWIYKKD